jgi:hypothetical protein
VAKRKLSPGSVDCHRQVIAWESPAEAWGSVQVVLMCPAHIKLAIWVEAKTVRLTDDRQYQVYLCPQCRRGRLHLAGRHELHDGRLSMGGLYICDRIACGYYATRQ